MKYMEHGEQFNNADDRVERTLASLDSAQPFESLASETGDIGREEGGGHYESPGEVYDALGEGIVELDESLEALDPRLLSLVNG